MKLSKAFIKSRIPDSIGIVRCGKGYLLQFKLQDESIMFALPNEAAQALCMNIYELERAQGRGQEFVDKLLEIVQEDLCLKMKKG
ncbi:MAG: hypothetical protein M0R06_10515 [Sphaerochaeta sp.]|jgi:hypothetical protein|nr:hypothetical protein [Sphaerochaeta sp.]